MEPVSSAGAFVAPVAADLSAGAFFVGGGDLPAGAFVVSVAADLSAGALVVSVAAAVSAGAFVVSLAALLCGFVAAPAAGACVVLSLFGFCIVCVVVELLLCAMAEPT